MDEDKQQLAAAATHAAPISIPLDKLSAAAIDGLIDAFVLREGTDYGAVEFAHATKVAQVRRQLESGDAYIVFDPDTTTTTLVTKAEWNRLTK